MKTLVTTLFVALFAIEAGAVVAPKNGGKLPQAYYNIRKTDKTAFRPRRAWINKARKLQEKRERFLEQTAGQGIIEVPGAMKVSGNFAIPIILGKFANTGADPYPNSDLQTEMFDGPWSPGTMNDYYNEISYGNLNVGGTVFNWVTVSQNDSYYEGTSNGLSPGNAHTGEFIKEILDALDGGVDFGQFDNDGPDGIPNSGDDDGYVDFIAVVHPKVGAECGGNPNIWSHSWVYRAWPISGGQPYSTNDTASGGGFIKIDDYTIQPAIACDGTTMVQIGVFCHEFGHAFGLPDLYDTDGGSAGIGNWGIMGSGNWNTPDSPAHQCAWSKVRMGWIVPTLVTWQGAIMNIPQAETNPVCFKLPFTQDRFRLTSECAAFGTRSMRCGLSDSEGATRQWKKGGGYGNLWDETVERDFTFDGTTPVTLSYDYSYESEVDYDYSYTIFSAAGKDTVIRSYAGVGSGHENIDLSSLLASYTPPVDYKIKFRFTSDWGWSDEDGLAPSTCGALVIDNLSVSGGGESYFTDYESFIDGWYQDPSSNPPNEYWLVENREATGFDANLKGSGLLIWHIDDEVMNSYMGNTGGGSASNNRTVRGVVLEEADGKEDLLNNVNRGDGGDIFPGTSNNVTFNSTSNPSSKNYNNRTTMIEVSSISSPGATMTAFMKAGDRPPVLTSVTPDTVDNDLASASLIIDGSQMRHGATYKFFKAGEADMVPVSTNWIGLKRSITEVNVYSKKGGYWSLIVANPDGQVDTLPNALYINQLVAAKLAWASVSSVEDGLEIRFSISSIDEGEKILVKRSAWSDGPWEEPNWTVKEVRGTEYRYVDTQVIPGRRYYYRIEAHSKDGGIGYLYTGEAVARMGKIALYQNYPNPFNPGTTISFYLPVETSASIRVFDVTGKLVRELKPASLRSGLNEVFWNGKDSVGNPVASGVYFYQLQAGKRKLTRKMVLMR